MRKVNLNGYHYESIKANTRRVDEHDAGAHHLRHDAGDEEGGRRVPGAAHRRDQGKRRPLAATGQWRAPAGYISGAPGPGGRKAANSARAERQQRYVDSHVASSGLGHWRGGGYPDPGDPPRLFFAPRKAKPDRHSGVARRPRRHTPGTLEATPTREGRAPRGDHRRRGEPTMTTVESAVLPRAEHDPAQQVSLVAADD